MPIPNASPKLAIYLARIEKETGGPIEIREVPTVGLPGMSAAFSLSSSNHILVSLVSGCQITDPDMEQSIAHEVTHGFLICKKGYCYPHPRRPALEREKRYASLLFTMVDDIVVNKIIHDEGFPPFSSKYLPEAERETKAARKGRDHYTMFSDDPLFKERFIIFRYVMAWGFMEYFGLGPFPHRTLKKFLKSFEQCYPQQIAKANQIKALILTNDIFTQEGHYKIMKTILDLWNLGDLIELKTV